jgi:hypothetical protein
MTGPSEPTEGYRSPSIALKPPANARRVVRTISLALGLLLLVFLAVAAVRIGPLLLAPNEFEGVPSIEGRSDYRQGTLMQAAWALPNATAYRRGGIEYQSNPSFCGPTSLANVMRSMGMPTDQNRVIDDSEFEPWFGILIGGLTLDELASLASERAGKRVTVVRDPTYAQFRALMRSANTPGHRVIANFHRGPLFGRGHGHFSPIIGYLERHDLVLVGDTNSEYRPFLVKSDRLWSAVNTIDEETGKKRGLIILQ